MRNRLMQAVRGIFILVVMIVTLTACQAKPDNVDNQNHPIYFSQYQGKWIVLNYWASWCHPCWAEVPELNAFAKHYQQQVVVFGVNFDGVDDQQLNQFMQKMQMQFPSLLHNPATTFGIGDISALPSTVIINPQGKVVAILAGAQTQQSLTKAIGLS